MSGSNWPFSAAWGETKWRFDGLAQNEDVGRHSVTIPMMTSGSSAGVISGENGGAAASS